MKSAKVASDILLLSPLVMGVRLSRMMLPEAMRTDSDRTEDVRMVAEKVSAASQGMVDMQMEMATQWSKAWMGLAFGQLPNVKSATDKVAAAGLKPVRTKVKSNVKRLSRRKVSK